MTQIFVTGEVQIKKTLQNWPACGKLYMQSFSLSTRPLCSAKRFTNAEQNIIKILPEFQALVLSEGINTTDHQTLIMETSLIF